MRARQAGIRGIGLPVDVAGLVTGEKEGHIGHLDGFPTALQWIQLADAVAFSGRPRHIEHGLGHAGFDQSGTDRIDPDSLAGELRGCGLHQADDPRLGRTVGSRPGPRAQTRHGCRADDRATAGLPHGQTGVFESQKGAHQIDAHHRLPLLRGHLPEGLHRPADAGVGIKDIELAEARSALLHHAGHIGLDPCIRHPGFGHTTGGLHHCDGLLETLASHINRQNRGPFFSKTLHTGAADAAGSSRDHSLFPLKSSHAPNLRSGCSDPCANPPRFSYKTLPALETPLGVSLTIADAQFVVTTHVMAKADLYATLGVARDADSDAIRKAFRKLARKYHPDVNANDPEKAEKFKEISFANEVLSDPEKRKTYDEFGVQGLDPNFKPEHARAQQQWGAHPGAGGPGAGGFSSFGGDFDLDDLLSRLSGRGGGFGGFGFGRQGPTRGADAEGSVTIDFLDAVRGEKVGIQLQGIGELQVTIPPGADQGTKIRLRSKGSPGTGGGPPGDLYLKLNIRPHAFFRREGDNLHVDLPVALHELIQGAEVIAPTPDGPVTLKVPKGSANGGKLRLAGKGATRRGSKDRGHLYVHLQATLPPASERLDAIGDELKDLYGETNIRARLGV